MSTITKDTIVADIMKMAPEALPLFKAVGMNCMGCAMSSGETLGQACMGHGVDPDKFLTTLNAYIEK